MACRWLQATAQSPFSQIQQAPLALASARPTEPRIYNPPLSACLPARAPAYLPGCFSRRNAYNMVVNKYGERLYRGLVDTETAHLHKVPAFPGCYVACQLLLHCWGMHRGVSVCAQAVSQFPSFTCHLPASLDTHPSHTTIRAWPPLPPPALQVAARIEAAQGEGFLRALKAEWEAHNKSVQMIRDILMYMDRIYVKHQVGGGCAVHAVLSW